MDNEAYVYDSGVRHFVRIRDNDPRGIIVSPTELEVTEEDTTGASYTVELLNQPGGDVTISINGANGTDLTLTNDTLVFTTDTWNVPQSVNITAAADDDTIDDVVVLEHSARGSGYDQVKADDVQVRIVAKDIDKGVNFSPPTLVVHEGDTTGTNYKVWLNKEPTADVTVTIAGTDGTDLTLSDSTLTFTTGNWNVAQTVNVKAGADADHLNDIATLTHTPSGGTYDGVRASRLPVTVIDDGGITVDPTTLQIVEGDDDGGSYGVVLKKEPTDDVTITVTRTGSSRVSADKTVLTFTTQNWSVEQRVKVTATEDDNDTTGSATMTHSASGGGYDNVPIDDVRIRTLEPDEFQIATTPTFLRILEGRSASYFVELVSPPVGDGETTITITGNDDTRVSVSPSTLEFDTENWNVRQEVTVTTIADSDDAVDLVTLTHTGKGGGYTGVTKDFRVFVLEEDDRGVTTNHTTRSVTEGGATTYTLALDTEPTDDVKVLIVVPKDGGFTVSDKQLTFTDDDGDSPWDEAQTVTINGSQDDDGDDESGAITHIPVGGGYEGADSDSVVVTVTDDDEPGVSIDPGSFEDVPEGESRTYDVVLDTRPGEDVTVTIRRTGDSSVRTNKTRLVFTPDAWNVPQEVIVTAAHDADADDDTATLEHTVSGYGDVTSADDVDVSTDDDDVANVTISPTSLDITEGSSRTYSVVLDTQPSGNVTVTVTETEDTDDSVTTDRTTLTFTQDTWDTEQYVRVSAVEDEDAEDGTATLEHSVSGYTVRGGSEVTSAEDVDIDVTDNEPAVVVEFGSTYYTVEESDDTGTTNVEEHKVSVIVTLDQDPNREVVIPLVITENDGASSGSDYVALPASVTFQAGDTEKEIVFTSIHDSRNDDGENVHIAFGTELPTKVSPGEDDETTVFINDDDGAGVIVDPPVLEVEEGESATYEIRLTSQPTGNVTITITPPDSTLVTVDRTTVSFTTSTWNNPETVTVRTQEDRDADDLEVIIEHSAASSDSDYQGIFVRDLPVTVLDDDLRIRDDCIASGELLTAPYGIDGQYDMRRVHISIIVIDPVEDQFRWKEPLIGVHSVACYHVQERRRGIHDSHWGEWGEHLDVGVYDPPPPGNWTSVSIEPRPRCANRDFRVRPVYRDGNWGPWHVNDDWRERWRCR